MYVRAAKVFAVLATVSLALLANVGTAGAFPSGEQGHVHISCDTLTIDPATWLTVTFSGTINGVPYSRKVFYGGELPHLAIAHIADLTTGTGPLTITSTTTGPFLGTSPTATKTVVCHQPPTTTTSTSTSTSTTSPSTPTSTTSSTVSPASVAKPKPLAASTSCGAPGQLPCTGSSSTLPLGGAAMLMVSVGAYFARGWRARMRTD